MQLGIVDVAIGDIAFQLLDSRSRKVDHRAVPPLSELENDFSPPNSMVPGSRGPSYVGLRVFGDGSGLIYIIAHAPFFGLHTPRRSGAAQQISSSSSAAYTSFNRRRSDTPCEVVMPETPAPADSMPPLITLPLFWPVAMVAGMEKSKADSALRNLEFVQEELKLHGGLKAKVASAAIPIGAALLREPVFVRPCHETFRANISRIDQIGRPHPRAAAADERGGRDRLHGRSRPVPGSRPWTAAT